MISLMVKPKKGILHSLALVSWMSTGLELGKGIYLRPKGDGSVAINQKLAAAGLTS